MTLIKASRVRISDGSPVAFVIVLKALNFSTVDFRDCPSDPHWFNKNLKTSLAAPFYVRFRFCVKNGKNLQLMSALCICVFAKEICFNIEQWRNWYTPLAQLVRAATL